MYEMIFGNNNIITNPELDMKQGIDVYLRNIYDPSRSGKLRIYKDSAQKWRDIKDKKRQKSYCSRSAGIRDKQGKLTKNNIDSPNYWSRKILWDCDNV